MLKEKTSFERRVEQVVERLFLELKTDSIVCPIDFVGYDKKLQVFIFEDQWGTIIHFDHSSKALVFKGTDGHTSRIYFNPIDAAIKEEAKDFLRNQRSEENA
jgi:hypothetical protein